MRQSARTRRVSACRRALLLFVALAVVLILFDGAQGVDAAADVSSQTSFAAASVTSSVTAATATATATASATSSASDLEAITALVFENEMQADICDQVFEFFEDVSSSGGSTIFKVRTSAIESYSSHYGTLDQDFLDLLTYFISLNVPETTWWFDKTGTISLSVSGGYLSIKFPVISEYASGSYVVSSDAVTAAEAALENAVELADSVALLSDEEKLSAFYDYILENTEYGTSSGDSSASSSGSSSGSSSDSSFAVASSSDDYYDGSFQLLNVFDDDDDTLSVCEGYAKALKYLCDLSGIDSYLVAGTAYFYSSSGTQSGSHMWNVVTIDGESFLTDLTNSDTDTIGDGNDLILSASGTADGDGKYSYSDGTNTIVFEYSDMTETIYSSYESDVLTLAEATSGICGDYEVSLAYSSVIYTGSAKKPSVTITVANRTLEKGTHYTVTYKNNTNAGTAYGYITYLGNYGWTKSGSSCEKMTNPYVTFKITKLSITTLSVSLSKTSYTYSASAKKPSVTVKRSSGKKLVKGTDYTVTYASGRKAIGRYKVKITGKGNYTGTVTKYFTIKPKKVTLKSGTKSTAKKKLTIKWKKAGGGVKYQIAYRKKGSSAWKYKKVSSSVSSKTISSLSSGKYYFVKVRAYKTVSGKTYWGSWSTTKKIKVK